jgi:cation diffusion facilitator CzcD-associated flavoprotein CzcO
MSAKLRLENERVEYAPGVSMRSSSGWALAACACCSGARSRDWLDVLAIEAGDDVGGTCYGNRYPGVRCHVMSIDYSYSFLNDIQQEWSWIEKFAAQPEILAYASFVADKFDLRRDTSCQTRATSVVVTMHAGCGGRDRAWPSL